jgi:flagellar biosynthesis protein FlhB
MSDESDDDSEKTEEPTPERRQKARDDGQFARARDSGAVAATVAVLLVMNGIWGDLLSQIRDFCLTCFHDPLILVRGDMTTVLEQTVKVLVIACLPISLFACLAGMAAGFAEAGFHPNFESLEPKFERLDPVGKLQKLFSPKEGLVNIAMSLLRVGLVSLVAYKVLEGEFPRLAVASRGTLTLAAVQIGVVTFKVAAWCTFALGILAAVDYAQSWWKHEQSIKMSRQELKEEMKGQDGNPQVKARQRQRGREMMKRGLKKAIKEATVIVTNPTHVAVALRYHPAEGAPTVVAKGYDEVAQHIKKLAKAEGIPMVENVPLARGLAEKVRVGRTIPADFYAAVAEVLAFVFRLRGRGRGVRA